FDGESTGEILMKHLTSAPDLRKLPPEYVPVVGKALAKNPAHRFQTLTEMARAVEAVGSEEAGRPEPVLRRPGTPVPRAAPVARVEPAPSQTPQVSVRGQLGELCGSMALTTLFAVVAFTIWASVGSISDLTEIGSGFFLTMAVCWTVLTPAKFWNSQKGDSGLRRGIMMVLGTLIGLGAFWLDGGTIHWSSPESLWSSSETEGAP